MLEERLGEHDDDVAHERQQGAHGVLVLWLPDHDQRQGDHNPVHKLVALQLQVRCEVVHEVHEEVTDRHVELAGQMHLLQPPRLLCVRHHRLLLLQHHRCVGTAPEGGHGVLGREVCLGGVCARLEQLLLPVDVLVRDAVLERDASVCEQDEEGDDPSLRVLHPPLLQELALNVAGNPHEAQQDLTLDVEGCVGEQRRVLRLYVCHPKDEGEVHRCDALLSHGRLVALVGLVAEEEVEQGGDGQVGGRSLALLDHAAHLVAEKTSQEVLLPQRSLQGGDVLHAIGQGKVELHVVLVRYDLVEEREAHVDEVVRHLHGIEVDEVHHDAAVHESKERH
mmetsp:Transcript_7799/g.32822  ORF Transcript_7799/g.32822 Transcript_7799/m.32822 type:complete len:336 (+) Transcript_7799:1719-2726(+)